MATLSLSPGYLPRLINKLYSSRLAPGELKDKTDDNIRGTQKPVNAIKKERVQTKQLVATFTSTDDLQAALGPLEML